MYKRISAVTLVVAMVVLVSSLSASENDLQKAVRRSLSNYYSIPFEISAHADGMVVVKGKVSTYWDKLHVFNVISRVNGVRFISDQVVVETESLPDNIIKSTIENGILNNSTIYEPEKIKVAVTVGEVILSGTLSFHRDAMVAEDIAAWQKGVRGVANEIRILPKNVAQSDENLSAVLRDVLGNNFPFEKNSVKIAVKNGEAMLTGTVSDLWAKDHIAMELRKIPGVTKVSNNLDVASRHTS